jgi:hypothetical protein
LNGPKVLDGICRDRWLLHGDHEVMSRYCLLFACIAIVFSPPAQGHGALQLDPSSLPQWTTNKVANLTIDDVKEITGFVGTLEQRYKNNVDGEEEGPFEDDYSTEYFDTPSDPQAATISYDQTGNFITDPIFLIVKGGNGFSPAQYIFPITEWNGTDDIELTDFWPTANAISHLEILGGNGTIAPEPTAAGVWIGLAALGGLLSVRRGRARI